MTHAHTQGDGVAGGGSSSLTYAQSAASPNAGQGLDTLRLVSGCGAALPLGGRWLWSSFDGGGEGRWEGEWGRGVVAKAAACLKSVLSRLREVGAQAEWAKTAGELLYQPSLLMHLAAQHARAAGHLDALHASALLSLLSFSPASSCVARRTLPHTILPTPIRDGHEMYRPYAGGGGWVEKSMRAQVGMVSARMWAYGAYLVPPNGRAPAVLAPLLKELLSMCLHQAEDVQVRVCVCGNSPSLRCCRVCMLVYVYVSVRVCVCVHIYAFIWAYIHVHMYIYM